jgi:hypothetical protein
MTTPREPGRDLRLERLGDRDGLRPAHLGDSSVSSPLSPGGSAREFLAAYQALIDAVFTAPGAAEWLLGLRLRVAALVAGKDVTPRAVASSDAIRAAGPDEPRPR